MKYAGIYRHHFMERQHIQLRGDEEEKRLKKDISKCCKEKERKDERRLQIVSERESKREKEEPYTLIE